MESFTLAVRRPSAQHARLLLANTSHLNSPAEAQPEPSSCNRYPGLGGPIPQELRTLRLRASTTIVWRKGSPRANRVFPIPYFSSIRLPGILSQEEHVVRARRIGCAELAMLRMPVPGTSRGGAQNSHELALKWGPRIEVQEGKSGRR